MKKILAALALLSILVLAGCIEKVGFETVEKGQNSGIQAARNLVFNDAKSFAGFWSELKQNVSPQPEMPEMDFDKYTVIAAALGSKPNGCYTIEIKDVRQTQSNVYALVDKPEPSEGAMCTQAFVQPYHIIKIPKTAKPVVFEKYPGKIPDNEPPPTDYKFEAHEWGVIEAHENESNAILTSRPEVDAMVKLPIVYFHAKNVDKFSAKYTLPSGKVTDVYPGGTADGKTAGWSSVSLKQETPSRALATSKGYRPPIESIEPQLGNVDSDDLWIDGKKHKFLFYEGEMQFENRVKAKRNGNSVSLTNGNDFAVYNARFVASNGGGFWETNVEAATAEKIDAGQTVALELKDFTPDAKLLENDLTSKGFTKSEANAFANAWYKNMFYPTNAGTWQRLSYVLPQSWYDEQVPSEYSVKPTKEIRQMYVLVKIREQPGNGKVEAKTDRQSYSSGETVKITATNDSDKSVFIQPGTVLCGPLSIIRLENGEWKPVQISNPLIMAACAPSADELKPGQSREIEWDGKEWVNGEPMPVQTMATGTFKARITYYDNEKIWEGNGSTAQSDEFTIGEKNVSTTVLTYAPIQCGENPWEKWHADLNRVYIRAPTEEEILKEYYSIVHGIPVVSYKNIPAPPGTIVCMACQCPRGDKIEIWVDNSTETGRKNVEKLVELGWKTEATMVT
ncbi:MAG: protease complex subunit PrcB family protein [Candidatus Diapherotrites archaeon]|nr:protease complex subunit PrcB family protein [Candidatus Diapherotrites archaeon]